MAYPPQSDPPRVAVRGFNPPGIVLPVSAAIVERIHTYRRVLESYSHRPLPLIEWEPTASFNIHVKNDTGDYYRCFDATPHAEFLYGCVQQTIEQDLPAGANFLRRYDEFRGQIDAFIDMPDNTVDLLFRFLHQNGAACRTGPVNASSGDLPTTKRSVLSRLTTTFSRIAEEAPISHRASVRHRLHSVPCR